MGMKWVIWQDWRGLEVLLGDLVTKVRHPNLRPDSLVCIWCKLCELEVMGQGFERWSYCQRVWLDERWIGMWCVFVHATLSLCIHMSNFVHFCVYLYLILDGSVCHCVYVEVSKHNRIQSADETRFHFKLIHKHDSKILELLHLGQWLTPNLRATIHCLLTDNHGLTLREVDFCASCFH